MERISYWNWHCTQQPLFALNIIDRRLYIESYHNIFHYMLAHLLLCWNSWCNPRGIHTFVRSYSLAHNIIDRSSWLSCFIIQFSRKVNAVVREVILLIIVEPKCCDLQKLIFHISSHSKLWVNIAISILNCKAIFLLQTYLVVIILAYLKSLHTY